MAPYYLMLILDFRGKFAVPGVYRVAMGFTESGFDDIGGGDVCFAIPDTEGFN
jgi:hypothetical protein